MSSSLQQDSFRNMADKSCIYALSTGVMRPLMGQKDFISSG